MALHLVQQSSSTLVVLQGYRTQIMAEIDGVALRVGRLLREAREACPVEFTRWVQDDLPFGAETARRLIAISAAYEKLPAATLRGLPRPWQAMYALKELPTSTIVAAVEQGEIKPEMTVDAAQQYARQWRGTGANIHRAADAAAGRLLRLTPADLSVPVRESLRTWLAS